MLSKKCPPGRIMVMLTDSNTQHLPRNQDAINEKRYRLNTFRRFPHQNVDTNVLAERGFYYTGIADRVQCAFCKILIQNWTIDDTPTDINFHYSNCSLLLTNQPNRLSTRSHSRTTNTHFMPSHPTVMLRQLFPCNRPKHVLFATLWQRRISFQASFSCNWTQHLRVSTDTLAEAGFFEVGNVDEVKCFYCGGSLIQWQYNDQPWVEHAKYFPTCHFLLRNRGPAYVMKITEEFPTIIRPHIIGNNPLMDIYEQILHHISTRQ